MIATEVFVVTSCLELNPGDEIQAMDSGSVVHRGTVTDLAPDHNLLWIIDSVRGGRRLLNLAELEVVRFPASRAATSSSDTAV